VKKGIWRCANCALKPRAQNLSLREAKYATVIVVSVAALAISVSAEATSTTDAVSRTMRLAGRAVAAVGFVFTPRIGHA